MPHEDIDVHLPAGRLRVRRWGRADQPPVICVPGLSANLVGFDPIAAGLEGAGYQAIAPDLRGRGCSEVTPPGTYGWPTHATDLVHLAGALRAERFDLVGWSMGAMVGLHVAHQAPDRLRRLVLIDAVGPVDAAVADIIRLSVDRLGAVYPSLPEYVESVRRIGLVRPWSELWERYFEYEMEPVPGGYRARSDRSAVLEDFDWGQQADSRDLWRDLAPPVLLVRAREPLLPSGGEIVPAAVRDEFLRAVPAARLVEVDANHYGVGVHPATVASILEFLGEQRPPRG